MSRKLFLTGAASDLGVRLLRSTISSNKYSITAYGNNWEKVPSDILNSINRVDGDIADLPKIKEACKESQVAIHLAWETKVSSSIDPSIYDVLAEEIYKNATLDHPGYLLAKSTVYTPGADKVNHHRVIDEDTEGLIPTGFSRSRLENHAISKSNQLLNVGIIRPAWIYGCNSTFDFWLKRIQAKQAITYTNDLNTYIPLVHAQDAADLAALMLEKKTPGRFFAVEKSMQLIDIIWLLRQRFGYDLKQLSEEYFGPKLLGIACKKNYSVRVEAKAAKSVGWSPRHSFEEFVARLSVDKQTDEHNGPADEV